MLKFEIYKSGIFRVSWKWRAIAPNGRIIASGRGFNSKENATKSIDVLIGYCSNETYVIRYV
jgi:uncharacterized protein YegP (UPF0339 family)